MSVLLNLYLSDFPLPNNPHIKLTGYTDDITIIATLLQPYLDTISTLVTNSPLLHSYLHHKDSTVPQILLQIALSVEW